MSDTQFAENSHARSKRPSRTGHVVARAFRHGDGSRAVDLRTVTVTVTVTPWRTAPDGPGG
ncbi:hypothetical protein ACFW6V_09165 [Streptomyces sp. NPDC058734]|uniref:hypothetical protein n=1 Tax=Streptomyces sp. NPDC058734 TaxID=3346615 RepID=UPI0036A98F42